ncbi:MAG TPA: outer membrane beta-barrel protein [Phaeodactylibacter sp.]|nr:outer membrane beta-barrel protein [Phaeodactylibacter sp.]
MKKLLFLLSAALLLSSIASAQFTAQGNFVIGSTIGFSAANSKITQDDGAGDIATENPTSTQFNFAPNIGYFMADNLAVGISMDYTFNQVERTDGDNNEDSNLLFGPFGRYYIPTASDMAFFLEGSFGFGNASDNLLIAGESQRINTNIMAFGLGPGFTIFSNSAVGIEALVKYNFARSRFDTDIAGVQRETVTRTNQFDFSIGFQFYLGGFEAARQPEGRMY